MTQYLKHKNMSKEEFKKMLKECLLEKLEISIKTGTDPYSGSNHRYVSINIEFDGESIFSDTL